MLVLSYAADSTKYGFFATIALMGDGAMENTITQDVLGIDTSDLNLSKHYSLLESKLRNNLI